MIRIVYNLLFFLFFCLSAPFYFAKMLRRGNWRGGFGQRFGSYAPEVRNEFAGRRTIWLHAVSVGEVNVCTELIRELRPRLPGFHFAVSTTTSTGMARLKEELPGDVSRIYYPIDLFWIVGRALRVIRPVALILVEAEIWPNLLWRLRREGVPAMVVNARLSDRSHRGYRKHAWLFRPIFQSFVYLGAQDETDAARFREIGYRDDAVEVAGVLKFDTAKPPRASRLDAAALIRRCGAKPDAPVLVAGSTHDGEEVILAGIAARLRSEFPDLFLVLVPRHMERRHRVAAALRERGVAYELRSRLTDGGNDRSEAKSVDCLVVDSTGELLEFYREASIVFVGKSLTAKGGQNPIEPGALGRAMVFGPNMQNFRNVARAFVEGGGAVQVADERGLETALRELLGNRERRDELGGRAMAVVGKHQGAVKRTAEGVVAKLRQAGAIKDAE